MSSKILDVRAGVHEVHEPEMTAERFPRARWGRAFVAGPGGTNLPASTTADRLISMVLAKSAGWLAVSGGGCVVSLKLDLVAVAAGVWDTRLTALARAVAGLNIIVIVNHEPEETYSAPVFARGFTAARNALKAGWPGLDVAYCAMTYQWRGGSKTTRDPAVWAQVDADLYLADVYSGKSFQPDATLVEHAGFRRWHAEVARFPGRRWGIAERGWLDTPHRVAAIGRESDWLATDPAAAGCEVYLVWGTAGREGNTGWLLDQAAEAAVEALLARITLPAGYTVAGNGQLVVHTASGAVIAADRTDAWDALYGRLCAVGAARSVL